MKTRFGLASAAAVALFATLAISSPANAAAGDCPNNRACGWLDTQYTGPMGAWASSYSNLGGYNDSISSMGNRRAAAITWFSDAGYSGSSFRQAPGTSGYFYWADWRNDSFSSVFLY